MDQNWKKKEEKHWKVRIKGHETVKGIEIKIEGKTNISREGEAA